MVLINNYVAPFKPLSNITPFTYRDGETYLTILERIRNFINTDLITIINENFTALGDDFELEVNKLIADVNEALAAQDVSNTNAIEALELFVNNTINTINTTISNQTTYVDSEIVDLTAYVNTSIASIINSTIEVSDPVVYAILNNPLTQSRILNDSSYLGKIGTIVQRLRDADDNLAQAIDYRHRGTSGYVFHGVSEENSGGFIQAFGTDAGSAGAIFRSHKNSGASEHAIGHGGSSLLNYWQGYSASYTLYAEVYKGNQGFAVIAKNGQGYGNGVTVAGSNVFTSATANFTSADIGSVIRQTTSRLSIATMGAIPTGTTIVSVTNSTTIVMSNVAGNSSTEIPFLIESRIVEDSQKLLTFYTNDGTTDTGSIKKYGFDFYGNVTRTAAAVSMTAAGVLASRYGSFISNIIGPTQNAITIQNYQPGYHTIFAKGVENQTADQLHVENFSGAIQSRLNKNGVFMTRITTVPDADLGNSEISIYIDPTPGSTKLMIKAKDSAGTVRSGSVTLA